MSQPQNNENVITVRRLMRALSSLWDKFTAALAAKADSADVQTAQNTASQAQNSANSAANMVLQMRQQLGSYQPAIADLDSIRRGAALGASALQEHQDISGKADASTVADLQADVNSLIQMGNAAVRRLETVENRPLPRVEVQMRMTKQRMFIICRKGELLQSDVPVFMRNVRTRNKLYKPTAEAGEDTFATVVKGWKSPLWFEKTHDGIISRERVTLYMVLLNGRDDLEEFAESGMSYLPLMLGKTNMYDFWEIVYNGYCIDDGGLALMMFNENGNSLLGAKPDDGQINDGSFSIYLQGKQLGIVITRNGLPITDIMSFRMQMDSNGDPIFGKWR